MGENSAISWTDDTFNPWMGCTKVSAGCTNCYAERDMDHRFGKVKWGPQGTRLRTSEAYWEQPLKWNKQAEQSGTRRRVFCASLADVFEDRPELEPWRIDLLKLIELTPHLDWLLLTKRPENVVPMIELAQDQNSIDPSATLASERTKPGAGIGADVWLRRNWHVRIGTSAEDQKTANERITELLRIPARVRFLSAEPLLGPISLSDFPTNDQNYPFLNALTGMRWRPASVTPNITLASYDEDTYFSQPHPSIDWVIVGGESGPKARPMHSDWVRILRDQCVVAGVPFHFKQWGEWIETNMAISMGLVDTYSDSEKQKKFGSTWFSRVGRNDAGRTLDGQTWDEIPE